MISTEQAVAQIDNVLQEVEWVQHGMAEDDEDLSAGLLPQDALKATRIRFAAAVDRLAPAGSRYAVEAQRVAEAGAWDGNAILDLAGILMALKADFQAGYLRTIEELIHGSVFDDFLDMASELLSKGYPVPAAVLAGSVLEGHVRQLAHRNGLDLTNDRSGPRSFEALTVDLVKSSQFGEPQRKLLAGWYAQRNAAAHGQSDLVIETELPRMIDGVRDFMVRHPA